MDLSTELELRIPRTCTVHTTLFIQTCSLLKAVASFTRDSRNSNDRQDFSSKKISFLLG